MSVHDQIIVGKNGHASLKGMRLIQDRVRMRQVVDAIPKPLRISQFVFHRSIHVAIAGMMIFSRRPKTEPVPNH